MASRRGMAIRIEQANDRIDAALERLASGQDVPAAPPAHRDQVLRQTERLEWIADVLDAVEAKPAPKSTRAKAPAKDAE